MDAGPPHLSLVVTSDEKKPSGHPVHRQQVVHHHLITLLTGQAKYVESTTKLLRYQLEGLGLHANISYLNPSAQLPESEPEDAGIVPFLVGLRKEKGLYNERGLCHLVF